MYIFDRNRLFSYTKQQKQQIKFNFSSKFYLSIFLPFWYQIIDYDSEVWSLWRQICRSSDDSAPIQQNSISQEFLRKIEITKVLMSPHYLDRNGQQRANELVDLFISSEETGGWYPRLGSSRARWYIGSAR